MSVQIAKDRYGGFNSSYYVFIIIGLDLIQSVN